MKKCEAGRTARNTICACATDHSAEYYMRMRSRLRRGVRHTHAQCDIHMLFSYACLLSATFATLVRQDIVTRDTIVWIKCFLT